MDTFVEDLIKLLLATLIGMLIGLERERDTKIGGFRTMMLIAMGSAFFTTSTLRVLGPETGRVVATIVQGVGFLGAGILINERGKIRGITTAATIWVVAALGAGIGLGYYSLSTVGAVLTFMILHELRPLKKWIDGPNRLYSYRLVLPRTSLVTPITAKVREFGLTLESKTWGKQDSKLFCLWEISGPEELHQKFAQYLIENPDITEFSFGVLQSA